MKTWTQVLLVTLATQFCEKKFHYYTPLLTKRRTNSQKYCTKNEVAAMMPMDSRHRFLFYSHIPFNLNLAFHLQDYLLSNEPQADGVLCL